jgi:hypothetical protein
VQLIFSNANSGQFQLQGNKFPKLPALGSDLTDEPFRWDHRLFTVFLNLSGHPSQRVSQQAAPSSERKQVEMIVEKMNGRFFDLNSHKNTNAVIDGILQQMQKNGVFVRFDRHEVGPAGSNVQSLEGEGELFVVLSALYSIFRRRCLEITNSSNQSDSQRTYRWQPVKLADTRVFLARSVNVSYFNLYL